MRRWLLVFMVLLLPLRGWVGEAMAGEMLGQQVAAQAHEVHAASMHGHDCDHGHGHDHDDSAAAHDTSQSPAAGDCPTCAACQVCSSVAMWPPHAPVSVAGFHHPAPRHVQRAFTSTEPVLAFKPPRG